ncbi:DNA polymerase III subunit beta [Candidatus Dependentiae bacterium Noda2021]|nr:DNA polymerase III subunit beta [Candidatus Dependentiae bacterium Noda2021]
MESNFIVEQKPFISLLSSMQPICTKRTTLDATSMIMFQIGHKEVVLKSTDLEISLQASYLPSICNITEPHSFLVPGKRIFDIVKELEGDIQFQLRNNQLSIKSGTVHLSLNIKEAQEFPPFPERIENIMHLDSSFLLNMLDKVAFLIPQNNANNSLNGLFLEISNTEFKMTTTDGHCLAQVSTDKYTLEEPKKWLLPRRAIFEVKKLLEAASDSPVFLGVCGNQLVFSGESFNFFTKLLADQFPQYNAILNKEGFVGATIDRSHLVKTLRRSSCLLSGQFIATKFSFDAHSLNVSMQNKEVGNLEENLPIYQFGGQPIDIRFYAPYLLSGLQAFADDKLHFFLKNPTKPILFQSETDSGQLTYLVMPVSPTTMSN